MEMEIRADRLALGDKIMAPSPKTVVSVGLLDLPAGGLDARVRIAYQDAYTPPETYKEDIALARERVRVVR